jgi:phosphate-selective porin OprO and OprP
VNSKNVFITVLAIFTSFWVNAQQDTTEYLPDGTQGEYLEVLKADTVPQKWRDKRWRLFPGKITTFKFGGGFLYEFAAFAPDSEMKRQMDSIGTTLEPTFKVRDFRVVASGQFKTKRHITWKLGVLYDGPSRSWLVRETGFMIEVPEISGHLFIGRTKEGFSLNKVMNGYAGWTMERQMALDVIPILADGIKWLGFLPKQRVLWNIGAFADGLSKGQSFSTFRWQFISRVGWLPLYLPDSKKLVHLGVSYRYGDPVDGKMRLRSRPEANPGPYFIDTGQFPSSHSDQIGGELYYTSGSWMIGSEFYFHKFSSVEAGDPVFTGGDFVVSYILTGESRPYNPQIGIYSFVPVKNPVFKGGTGAIEAVVRLSTLDLDDGSITGGKFWRITPMVNWYLTKDVRFEVAYGYGVLERFSLKGTTHFFQTRLQLTLL